MDSNSAPEAAIDEILVFELSGQSYGLRSSMVSEVLRAFSAVPLPNAPPLVEGILNIRGELLALVNVRKRFGLAERALALSDHFIVVSTRSRRVVLRVDRVQNLVRVPIRKMIDAEQFLSQAGDLLQGVIMLAQCLLCPSTDCHVNENSQTFPSRWIFREIN